MSDQETRRNRVQDLTWGLIDERASEADCRELAKLLEEHLDVREVYVQCMQLHTDLVMFFNGDRFAPTSQPLAKAPPVLPAVGPPWTAAQPQQPQ